MVAHYLRRLPVFAFWFRLRSRWPQPALPEGDEMLVVSVEAGRILVDISDRRFRNHLGISLVASRIEGPLAITNGYRQRLIGRLAPGNFGAHFRSVRRFPLPLEFSRPDRGFIHGFDALVDAIGPDIHRMSVKAFVALKGQCVQGNLEADGWSWRDYFSSYIK